jgi:hypothetical protein
MFFIPYSHLFSFPLVINRKQQFMQRGRTAMAASMRISSQVWPIWLPRAVARAEKKMLNAKLSFTISKQQINPLPFSATFRSLLSQNPVPGIE